VNITNVEYQEPENSQMNYLEAFRNLDSDSSYKNNLLSLLMSRDAHYGHQISSHNPMVLKYLYGEHGDVHVINLTSTMFLLKKVLNNLVDMFSESNTRLLFVGSKEQMVDIIKNSAERCGQYYVNHRWFGGTLTNWTTIQKSIRKMTMIENELAKPDLIKKEKQRYERILNKLLNSLGGIRKMSSLPDIIFVTDTNREKVAIAEANKLGIPVIALLDSNSSPIGVDYPIPCNDDSQDAVGLICQLVSDAILTGIENAFEKRQAQQKEREQNRRTYANRRNFVKSDSEASNVDSDNESSNNGGGSNKK
jgi:small subunit ribosomal protein S2